MQPKKSLGQNFLTSTQVVHDIVEAGGVSSDDTVLEIGPGKGILTRALLKTGAKVVAVEKDEDMIPILEDMFVTAIKSGQLTLLHEDILNTKPNTLTPSPYKLIANIPYYITGQIIEQFLTSDTQPSVIVLLVQKEVANRIAKDKKESILSMSVKVYGKPTYIRTVKASQFNPVPNVDSAVLKIEDISKDFFKDIDEGDFFALVKGGFAQKRKQLANNLPLDKEKAQEALINSGLDQHIRAENLTIEDWKKLAEEITL